MCRFPVPFTCYQFNTIKDDKRNQIHLSKFGLLPSGYLFVNMTSLRLDDSINTDDKSLRDSIGLTLVKTSSLGITPSMHNSDTVCPLKKSVNIKEKSRSVMFFYFNFKDMRLEVDRGDKDLSDISIWTMSPDNFTYLHLQPLMDDNIDMQSLGLLTDVTTKSADNVSVSSTTVKVPEDKVQMYIPIQVTDDNRYSFHFLVSVENTEEQGLYNLFYHNCYNNKYIDYKNLKKNNFLIQIEEKNLNNYLSAGDIPLPTVYFVFFLLYFMLSCVWLTVIQKAKEEVFKIHHLMLTLVCVKFMALFFHALNLHFIQNNGHHDEAFAILYYITYLIRGIVLFVTIVLIGAGWAFIKYILSDRDKKIFIIVIPLQILANMAQIFLEETEEGQMEHLFWRRTFYIVDLLCCVAIIFPIIASIRHLTEGSQTDGKAAINLSKLIIFRHFYMMIICYIYFTRIIDYLMQVAVPFQYLWVSVVFREIATITFFTFTGYKFQPMNNNPYLQLTQDSEDDEINEIMTQNFALDSVHKVNQVTYGNDDNDDDREEVELFSQPTSAPKRRDIAVSTV